ncbi:uncharacterized protein LOC144133727 [Amblyomma americanum]
MEYAQIRRKQLQSQFSSPVKKKLSCVGFIKREHKTGTVDVLDALNISFDSLVALTTGRNLFQFVASTSLRTGLASVVSVTVNGSQLVLDAGSSLELLLPHGLLEHYVEETLRDLRVVGGEGIVGVLLAIDGTVTSWLQQRKSTEPFVTRRLGSLQSPFAGATWADALSSGGLPANFTGFHADVEIRAEPQIYGALSALAATSVERARLYALLVFVAQVMRYRYVLTSDAAQHLSPEAVARLRSVVDALKSSFLSEAGAENIAVGEFNITIIGETGITDRNDTSLGTTGSSSDQLLDEGASFLSNVVRASAGGVGQPPDVEANVDRQLRSSLLLTMSPLSGHARYAITLSATLLSEPSFVDDPSLPELDYATVGVQIMRLWLYAELRENAALSEALRNRSLQCPSSNVTSSADIADVAVEWALRTALAASRVSRRQRRQMQTLSPPVTTRGGGDREDNKDGAWLFRDRVFFWRFCHSLCGDPRIAGLCDLVLPRVPGFPTAFGCRPHVGVRCRAEHRILYY